MGDKIYPRTGDRETVYLKDVVTGPNIQAGGDTFHNNFAHDPRGTIEKLEDLRWWDWEEEKIRHNIPAIQAGDMDTLENSL